MVFIKGIKHSIEEKVKAKQARYKKFGKGFCITCGKEILKYNKETKTCGSKECKASDNQKIYRELKIKNPIRSLAQRISGNIRLEHKTDKIELKIKNALDKPCGYCGVIITLENASLDHKIPRKFSKLYDRRTGHREYSDAILRELDSEENLHIVCRTCNQLKSDMDDGQFKRFVKWLKENPDIEPLIRKRLGYAKIFWKTLSR
jgi:5-methylcytosine-specific restriction endonuclease McrA